MYFYRVPLLMQMRHKKMDLMQIFQDRIVAFGNNYLFKSCRCNYMHQSMLLCLIAPTSRTPRSSPQIQVSFVEVYNEKIHDLLQFEGSGQNPV